MAILHISFSECMPYMDAMCIDLCDLAPPEMIPDHSPFPGTMVGTDVPGRSERRGST